MIRLMATAPVPRAAALTSRRCGHVALACTWAFFGLVVAQFFGLAVGLFAEPDLRPSFCDFPEECLDIFSDEAFATVRRLWWAGVIAAAFGFIALALTSAPRVRLLRVGVATALFGASALLSPVLRYTAISYDKYGVVTVLSVQYLFALVFLQASGLILMWDLIPRLRPLPRPRASQAAS
jgi:hypothetical protein